MNIKPPSLWCVELLLPTSRALFDIEQMPHQLQSWRPRLRGLSEKPALIGRAEQGRNARQALDRDQLYANHMPNSRFALLPAIAATVAASNVSTAAT